MAEADWREREARSITRRWNPVDAWFLGRYGMNLYRGCQHGCLYCDGRAERYYVPGDFAREILVKRNAVELLARELAHAPEPGFVLLGGGVCDAWQPAEERYALARGALAVALRHGFPVHVLTKSVLARRDLDLLARIGTQSAAVLSCSIQTTDDAVRRAYEPGASAIEDRWALLAEAKRRGLGTGVYAMPVLPGISDQPDHVEALVARAAEVGVDFVCYGGLTLRPGVQREVFLAALERHHPQHREGYQRLYREARPSGAPDARYLARIDARFREALDRHHLPSRMPRRLFQGLLPAYAETAVLLEHRAHERPADPAASTLDRAGRQLQDWARPRLVRASRGHGGGWRAVERQFLDRLADGSLAEQAGWSAPTLAVARELLHHP